LPDRSRRLAVVSVAFYFVVLFSLAALADSRKR
jgi:hypothetical protein